MSHIRKIRKTRSGTPWWRQHIWDYNIQYILHSNAHLLNPLCHSSSFPDLSTRSRKLKSRKRRLKVLETSWIYNTYRYQMKEHIKLHKYNPEISCRIHLYISKYSGDWVNPQRCLLKPITRSYSWALMLIFRISTSDLYRMHSFCFLGSQTHSIVHRATKSILSLIWVFTDLYVHIHALWDQK